MSDKMLTMPDGTKVDPAKITVGIEKFRTPNKYYRVIMIYGGKAWLATEDKTEYKRASDCVEAAKKLREKYGIKAISSVTR